MMTAKKITPLTGYKTGNLSIFGNTVTLAMTLDDEYKAQVLFEDLGDRLQRGEQIIITPNAGANKRSMR